MTTSDDDLNEETTSARPLKRLPLRIAYVSMDARMNFLRDALALRGCDVMPIEGDDIDTLTKIAGAAVSFAVPRMEWWIRYQMSLPVRKRRTLIASRKICDGTLPDAIVFAGSWFSVDVQGADGRRIPTFHYIDQSMSRAPLPGEQPGWGPFGRPGISAQMAMYARAEKVFTMSEWARDHTLAEHPHLTPDRVEAIGWGPCAVDLSASTVAIDEKERLVLLVAMDFYRKGVDHFAAVATAVRRESPDTRFVLIGADQSRSEIRLGDDVEYMGIVRDRAVLEQMFMRSRVFLMPHRYDRSPHVLVEAASGGTPVITGVQGGPPEVPRRGGGGAVHQPHEHQRIADNVRLLLDDARAWSVASAAAREAQRSYYSWNAIADKLISEISASVNRS